MLYPQSLRSWCQSSCTCLYASASQKITVELNRILLCEELQARPTQDILRVTQPHGRCGTGCSVKCSDLSCVYRRSLLCLRASAWGHLLAGEGQRLGSRTESDFVPNKLGAFLSATLVFFCLFVFFFFF